MRQQKTAARLIGPWSRKNHTEKTSSTNSFRSRETFRSDCVSRVVRKATSQPYRNKFYLFVWKENKLEEELGAKDVFLVRNSSEVTEGSVQIKRLRLEKKNKKRRRNKTIASCDCNYSLSILLLVIFIFQHINATLEQGTDHIAPNILPAITYKGLKIETDNS